MLPASACPTLRPVVSNSFPHQAIPYPEFIFPSLAGAPSSRINLFPIWHSPVSTIFNARHLLFILDAFFRWRSLCAVLSIHTRPSTTHLVHFSATKANRLVRTCPAFINVDRSLGHLQRSVLRHCPCSLPTCLALSIFPRLFPPRALRLRFTPHS